MASLTGIHSILDKGVCSLRDIKLFLESDSSYINKVNGEKETPLLSILQKKNCTVEVVNLLLKFGANVNCKDIKSRNSLSMALEFSQKEDIIKALLENGANVNDSPVSSLCLAFKFGASKSVIQLLLDAGCSTAVYNFSCDPTVVKLLCKHGVGLNLVDTLGQTALHLALKQMRQLSVIKSLLDGGAEINQENKSRETPLIIAVMHFREAEILEELLAAGAFVNFCLCRFAAVLLKPEAFERIKVLLRYFFLQNFFFDIECMFEHCQPDYSASVLKFRDECKHELLKMKSNQIGEDFSLYEFLSEYAFPRIDSRISSLSGKKYYFDRLLKSIADNAYPLYFNIISAKVGISSMKEMLKKVQVYTLAYSLDHPFLGKRIFLNYEIMCNIARFSAHDDLLRLILAFYNPRNQPCTGQASNEKNKRKNECDFKCRKRPKLQ